MPSQGQQWGFHADAQVLEEEDDFLPPPSRLFKVRAPLDGGDIPCEDLATPVLSLLGAAVLGLALVGIAAMRRRSHGRAPGHRLLKDEGDMVSDGPDSFEGLEC